MGELSEEGRGSVPESLTVYFDRGPVDAAHLVFVRSLFERGLLLGGKLRLQGNLVSLGLCRDGRLAATPEVPAVQWSLPALRPAGERYTSVN